MNVSTRDLKVARSRGRGRGVFAARSFSPGEIIEQCPVVLVPRAPLDDVPSIWELSFSWSRNKAALALGFGSLYNHSWEPNARYDVARSDDAILFTALRRISKGEEIFVNYNGDPEDRTPLWFQVK